MKQIRLPYGDVILAQRNAEIRALRQELAAARAELTALHTEVETLRRWTESADPATHAISV